MKLIYLKEGERFIKVSPHTGNPIPVSSILTASTFELEEALEYQAHFQLLTVVEVELNFTEKAIREPKKELSIISSGPHHLDFKIDGIRTNFSNLTKSFIQSSIRRLYIYVEVGETVSVENLLKRIDRNKLLDREKADAYDFLKTILEIK